MPQPTRSDLHVNTPLTNISTAFIQDQTEFIAGWMFPSMPVMKQSDRLIEYSRRDWLRAHMQKLGLGMESVGADWRVSNDKTYFADVWALHVDIDDQQRANQDGPIDLDRDATIFLTQQGLLRKDIVWADDYFKEGVWSNLLTGVAGAPGVDEFKQWNDPTSTPIKDIKKGIRRVHRRTGKKPNRLAFEPQTWDVVSDHPNVVDRIKHTQTGVLDLDLFAQLVGMKAGQVRVAEGVTDTALEDVDEDSNPELVDYIMPLGALLTYAAEQPSILNPSGGYTFNWTGLLGAGAESNRILTMRADLRHSDRVEAQIAFDSKLLTPEVGIFFKTPIATP